ncbi:hypothetical protein HUA74_36625 [Myxococcus sp. CA051A]|uniref:hypothetical protein n=1 Tax=Myxococcus sp. CA051A TaxID=2741739 RepID=UPI00157AB6C0|nr:hypothetical protein [Myxococcus sp. CA051A]NTX66198.1 hypothetical protein [Myxococcus sp. CA051A]
MMLIYPVPNLSLRDRWWAGKPFQRPPSQLIVVGIIPGNEQGELLDYFNTANLMSNAFHAALLEAGVDSLDVYDAVIQSEDGTVVHRGYKVFNVIGLVRAANLAETVFHTPDSSRLIDASIDHLAIDGDKPRGLKLFRLAENVSAVLVHEDVKRVLESKAFPHLRFLEPHEFVSA